MLLLLALLVSLINFSCCSCYMCYRDNTRNINQVVYRNQNSLMISTLMVFILTMVTLESMTMPKKSE